MLATYEVHASREGDRWLADVPDLEGTQTYASNLTALDRYVREIIVLAADLPASERADLTLRWSQDLGDQRDDKHSSTQA